MTVETGTIQSEAEYVYNVLDTYFGELPFGIEEVEDQIKRSTQLGIRGCSLREGTALTLWSEYELSETMPKEVKKRLSMPRHMDDHSEKVLNEKFSVVERRYINDIQKTCLPPEISRAISELVTEGIGGYQGIELDETALTDIFLRFQRHLYEFTQTKTHPLGVYHNDDDAHDLLFDDRKNLYYLADEEWGIEQRLDKPMFQMSVTAALMVMERAARIRAEQAYGTEELVERINGEDTRVIFVLDHNHVRF